MVRGQAAVPQPGAPPGIQDVLDRLNDLQLQLDAFQLQSNVFQVNTTATLAGLDAFQVNTTATLAGLEAMARQSGAVVSSSSYSDLYHHPPSAPHPTKEITA